MGLKVFLWGLFLCGLLSLGGGHTDIKVVLITLGLVYMLSSLHIMEHEEPALTHGIGGYLQQFCNAWQLTRTGIVFHGASANSPTLFLPWHSIRKASKDRNGIRLKENNGDSVFLLPVDKGNLDAFLTHIQTHITEHRSTPTFEGTEDTCIIGFSKYQPHGAVLFHSLLWLGAGACVPLAVPHGLWFCAICFAMAAAFYLPPRRQAEINYADEMFYGDEIRRTQRGIHIRGGGGWHYFQPWQGFLDCFRTATDAATLDLPGEELCLSVTYDPDAFPLSADEPPVARRMGWGVLRFLLILLAFATGLQWWALWN